MFFLVKQAVTGEGPMEDTQRKLSEKSFAWNTFVDESDGLIRRTASSSFRFK